MIAVTGIRSASSLGVARYCSALADALSGAGFDYPLGCRPEPLRHSHWHLANSSRQALWQAPGCRAPFVVTVHDVLPRSRIVCPAYRLFGYPYVLGRARRIVVHSRFAADLLVQVAGVDPRRLDVIPHGAHPRSCDRSAARRALGIPPGARLAVLPGVSKSTKLVAQAIEALRPLHAADRWQLLLAGRGAEAAVRDAHGGAGVTVLDSPSDEVYNAAIAASDAVLVLRSHSVGETNGPLLDALGSGRAIVATSTGSIPELAGAAAVYCTPTVGGIRAALVQLDDDAERAEREQIAAALGVASSWATSAEAHVALFGEAFDG